MQVATPMQVSQASSSATQTQIKQEPGLETSTNQTQVTWSY